MPHTLPGGWHMGFASDYEQVDHEEDGKHRERGDFKSKWCFSHDSPWYECRMTGRRLLARLSHLPEFLLQVADLIAQTRGKLELQLFGGRVHLLGQLPDQIG